MHKINIVSQIYLRNCERHEFDVIKSIFWQKNCSFIILNDKLSKTPRCSKKEVDAFLLGEWVEHDVKDDELVSDPAQKVLWSSNLVRLHNLKVITISLS